MSGSELRGKTVIVTGAGHGLGQAYALDAARHGADVVVNDVDGESAQQTVDLIVGAGGRAVADASSVTDDAGARSMVAVALEHFDHLDGLVNNAGAYYHTPPWEDTLDRIEPLVRVNLIGTMLCGIEAMRVMRERGRGGSIVNVTSGTHLGSPAIAAYVASKGGVIALTRSWALDLMDSGIRVNAISPVAATRMMATAPGGARGFPAPQTVAPLSSWLLSDDSRHFTGQVVRLTGGELRVLKVAEHVDPPESHAQWTFAAIDGVLGESAWRRWVSPLQRWVPNKEDE